MRGVWARLRRKTQQRLVISPLFSIKMALSHKKTYNHLSSITFFYFYLTKGALGNHNRFSHKKGENFFFPYLNGFYLFRTNKFKAITACRNDQLKDVMAVILVTNHGPFGHLFMTISLWIIPWLKVNTFLLSPSFSF